MFRFQPTYDVNYVLVGLDCTNQVNQTVYADRC